MRVGIHQPNFLPHQAYFAKIAEVDVFVLLDNVSYSKGSYTNRVRVQGETREEWLTIPVQKSPLGTEIKNIKISDTDGRWKERHLRYIRFKLRHAMSDRARELLERLIDCYEDETYVSLSEMNCRLLKIVAQSLGIKARIELSSSLPLENVRDATDRLINICEHYKADSYVSGKGGFGYMDLKRFKSKSIQVVQANNEELKSQSKICLSMSRGLSVVEDIC